MQKHRIHFANNAKRIISNPKHVSCFPFHLASRLHAPESASNSCLVVWKGTLWSEYPHFASEEFTWNRDNSQGLHVDLVVNTEFHKRRAIAIARDFHCWSRRSEQSQRNSHVHK